MLVVSLCGLVVLAQVCQVQALPTPLNLQGYRAVPAVSPFPLQSQQLQIGPEYFRSPSDTLEVKQAKAEFMAAFQRALYGLLYELAPQSVENNYLQDTKEVRQAKQEFMETFDAALDGIIESSYLEDTAEVKEEKEKFFKVFDKAMNSLLATVENVYLEDTPEVKEAKETFNQAFEDAEAGKIGAQYLDDTPEVKEAKERFFWFFDFALSGMLDQLIPVPGNNVLHPEIADFYIKDDPEVSEAKKEFDALYRKALNGDLAAALAVAVIEDNNNDFEAAVEDLSQALEEIEETPSKEEVDYVGGSGDYEYSYDV